MNSAQLEAFLARLYTDEALRSRFLDDPEALARAEGMAEQEASALAAIDRTGLQMAATSFTHKRQALGRRKGLRELLR